MIIRSDASVRSRLTGRRRANDNEVGLWKARTHVALVGSESVVVQQAVRQRNLLSQCLFPVLHPP